MGCTASKCDEMKQRSIRRVSDPQWEPDQPVPPDKEREKAVLLLGAATRHLDKCEIEEAGQDIARTVAFYEGRSWLFDVGYARALIARGRLRQLSNDSADAVTDFNKGMFILSRHETENASLMLGASWRLADCYTTPDAKEQQRAVIERGLDFASHRLAPIEDAKSNQIDGYSSVLALLERYDVVAEESAISKWNARFGVQRWKWGEPWDPASSDASVKGDERAPSCRLSARIPESSAVGDSLREAFKRCFRASEEKIGSFQGTTRLWAYVAADGGIRSMRGISIGVPPDCNACLTRAVSGIRFKPPAGGSLGIEFPIVYAVEPPP
jgi:hypothetical protein